MPDPFQIASTLLVAALVTASIGTVMIRYRSCTETQFDRCAFGFAVAVAIGFLIGIWWLDLFPARSLSEDRGRLVWLLLPAVMVIEWIASFRRVPKWIISLLRSAVACGIAPVVLWGSVYFSNPELASPRTWTLAERFVNLGAMAGLATGVRFALSQKLVETLPFLTMMAMGISVATSGVVIMLSGYATGGQFAFPLAATCVVAGLLLARHPHHAASQGAISVVLVLFFGMLVAAVHFAELQRIHGVALATSTVPMSVVTLRLFNTTTLKLKIAVGIFLVLLPLAIVLYQAQRRFVQRSAPASPSAVPSLGLDDYMNFRN